MNDKFQHALVCYALMLTGEVAVNVYVGLTLSLGFAIGKEWWDCVRKDGTGWDWNDLYADLTGIILALAVYR
jgi:uncharacterized protein YfiM (DUF2279 family)